MNNKFFNFLTLIFIVPSIFAQPKIPKDALINLIDITGQTIAQIDKKTLKLIRKMCPPLLHVTIELTNGTFNMPTGLNKNELLALMKQIETGNITPFAPAKVQPNRYVPKNTVDLDAGIVAK